MGKLINCESFFQSFLTYVALCRGKRQLPWSPPGDSRAAGVAGVRRLRLKGRDPCRGRERGQALLREEESGRRRALRLNLRMVMKHSMNHPCRLCGWCEFINSSLWSSGLAVQSKFEEIRKSNQAAAQRLVESHFSSSSDDEDDNSIDDGDHKEGKRGKILASAFTTYTDQTGEQPGIAVATPL